MAVSWPRLSWRQLGSERRGPFDAIIKANKVRVVLDTHLEPDDEGKLDYLRELLQLDQYEVFTRLQPGEKADGSRFRLELPERSGEPTGRDVAAAIIDRPDGSWSVHYLYAVRKNMQAARNRAVTLGIDPEAAAEAALLEYAASRIGADILITEREWLLASRWSHGANPVSVGEALAVLGLHMRSTREIVLRWLPSDKFLVDIGMAELVQSWTLLPAVLDVVSHAPSDTRWPHLLRETVFRMEKILRARDNVLLAALITNTAMRSDVASEMETLALSATAIFDIIARAASMAIPLDMVQQLCSFRNKEYRKKLRSSAPDAASVVSDPKVSAVINIAANLRHAIHAMPLRSVGYGDERGRTEQLVLVPTDFARPVRDSAEVLGKANAWLKGNGIEELGLGGVLVHPELLANDLVIMVSSAANALVASIPWARDPASPGWGEPRGDDPMAPFYARRIQWLYGLSAVPNLLES